MENTTVLVGSGFVVAIILFVLYYIITSQKKLLDDLKADFQKQQQQRAATAVDINIKRDDQSIPSQPLKSDTVPVYQRTRGEYAPRQIGTLSNDDKILPLYGKQTYSNSSKWNYYTTTDGYNQVALPVEHDKKDCMDEYGCNEIYDKDTVTVPQYSKDFTAKIYNNSQFQYIPY